MRLTPQVVSGVRPSYERDIQGCHERIPPTKLRLTSALESQGYRAFMKSHSPPSDPSMPAASAVRHQLPNRANYRSQGADRGTTDYASGLKLRLYNN